MDVNIKTAAIEVTDELFSGESSVSAESDLIVPDNMPDVLTVLQVSANCAIASCDAQTDRILLTGNVFFNILYLADGPKREVRSMNTKAVFSNIFSAPGINDTMPVNAAALVDSAAFTLANCRKLTVRAEVLCRARVYGNRTLTLPTEIEGAEMLSEPLAFSVVKARGAAQETVTDSFELPPGKPAAVEILRDEVLLTDKAVKVIHNKAIVKGTVSASALYRTETGLEQAKTEIPFTKVVNVEGLEDGMEVDCVIDIQGWETALAADENGENRTVDVETMLYFTVTGRVAATCSAITDAYLPGGSLECEKSALSLSAPPVKDMTDCAVKGTIRLPSDSGDLEGICDVRGCPRVTRLTREDDAIAIEGAVTVSLLYRTNNPEAPVNGYSCDVDFSASVPGEAFAAMPTASVVLRHMSCSPGSGNTVEVRGLAGVTLTSAAPCERTVITSVKAGEAEKKAQPSILISYIAEERSLWDIAKKYNISRAKLASANDISSEEELKTRRALVIPR